jgi:hypothetical protein
MTVEATLGQEVVAPLLEPIPVVTREFGRAHNRVHFPRAMFDEPLPQADSHTLQMCIAQCDLLMQRNERRRGITAVVRSKLFRESGRFPTLPEMAAELAVHRRTLRQLVEEVSKRWATPTPRRSATRSSGGMGSRPARIRAPARPSATGRRPWRRRSSAGRLAASVRRR